jgi:hypothetical protein
MEQKIIITAEKVTVGDKEYILRQVEKAEPEIGKWYKLPELKKLAHITKIEGHRVYYYGFCGNWISDDWFNIYHINNAIEATHKEVEEALISEAKKRGFKNGVTIKRDWLTIGYDPIATINTSTYTDPEFNYHNKGDCLEHHGFILYENGKWAEIIPDKKHEVCEALLREIYSKSHYIPLKARLEKELPEIKF